MFMLDAKVRSWYSDRPRRPWVPDFRSYYRDDPGQLLHAGQTNSPDMVLAELDDVGIAGAILTPAMVYGRSMELEFEAIERHPGRFALFGVADHLDPDLRQVLARSVDRGLRGLHIPGLREAELVARGEFDPLLDACAELGVTVTMPFPDPIRPPLLDMFRRHRGVFFYLDGVSPSNLPLITGMRPSEPFRHLGSLLLLAHVPNVGVLLSGVPALSFETYPYRDVWSAVEQVVTAYGPERVSWASDFTRTAGLYSYADGATYLTEIPSLSDEQRMPRTGA